MRDVLYRVRVMCDVGSLYKRTVWFMADGAELSVCGALERVRFPQTW